MRYCGSCGTLNETDAKFCAGCGKRLGAGAASDEVKEAQQVNEPVHTEQPYPTQVMWPAEKNRSAHPEDEPMNNQIPYGQSVWQGASSTEATAQQTVAQPQSAATPPDGDHTLKGRIFGGIGFGLNIEALICCWIPYANFVALIMAIIGLIFCRISGKNTDFKLARIGKILGIIALILSVLSIIMYIVLLILFIVNYGEDFADAINQASDGMINIYFGN